jgi:hypothetical protein
VKDLDWLLGRVVRTDHTWPGPPWPWQVWDEDSSSWQHVGLAVFKVLHVAVDTTLPSAPILVMVEASSCTITLPAAARFEGLQAIVKTTADVYDTLVVPPAGTLIDDFRESRRLLPLRTMVYLSAGGLWFEISDVRLTE